MEFLYVIGALLFVLLIFILVLIIRAIRFKPIPFEKPTEDTVEVDGEKAFYDLSEMIKCKTVSHFNKNEDDEEEFTRFKSLLPKLFPEIFKHCTYTEPCDRAMLFRLKGENEGEPCVLMAHYDVVSADEAKWQKPAFEGIIEDGVLWGRGTLDTKVTLNAAMQALESLLKQGFKPTHDVYLAFAGDEEINGVGALSIVDYFEKQGITPAFVLDEGGAVVNNVFPGVTTPCALIGIAEKGMLNLGFTCTSNGGHSSAPKPHTPVGILSKACVKVEAKPFKMRISNAAYSMLSTLARNSNFLYRLIFANLKVFAPLLDMICKKSGGEINALIRTTCAFTQMKGSDGMNVIPTETKMVANLRIIPGETVESSINYIKKVINDDKVSVSCLYGSDPSRVSRTDTEGYELISKAISSTWRGTIVSPYLMVACSDSRHWGRLSDRVYRFSAMQLSNEERASVHGNDEKIPYETVKRAVEFYTRIIKNC